MKSIDDIRRENLGHLRDLFGGLKRLAEVLERDDSQVSQWIQGSKNSGTGKPRGMRSDTARFIETMTKKPEGWMDRDHSYPVSTATLEHTEDPRAQWTEANVTSAPSRGRIPLISWVKAGSFSDVQDLFQPGEADEWVNAYQTTPSSSAFALTVEGDSMTATSGRSFPHGCTIIVDPNRGPRPGDFVVAKDIVAQRATFKQLTSDGLMSYLKPLNPAYPTQAIDDNKIRIVGVVIEWFIGGKL